MNIRSILIFIAAVSVLFAPLSSQAAPTSADSAMILRISSARLAALEIDYRTYARYTSKAFKAIDPAGEVTPRARSFAKSSYSDTLAWRGTPSVRFIGNVVQLTGYAVEVEKYPGGTITTDFRRSEIYAKEHGQWLAQASQVTIIPKNYAKPMAQQPTNLGQFTGRYEWAPGVIETLSVQRGRLVSSFDRSNALFFTAADSVMAADDLGVGIFYRDPFGKVAGYVYRRPDGQTIRIKKLP